MVMCRYVFVWSLKVRDFTEHIGVVVTVWNSVGVHFEYRLSSLQCFVVSLCGAVG
jgi:hypothetical protein